MADADPRRPAPVLLFPPRAPRPTRVATDPEARDEALEAYCRNCVKVTEIRWSIR